MRKRRTRKFRAVTPVMHGDNVTCTCGGVMRIEEYIHFSEPQERFVVWRCQANRDHLSFSFPFPLNLEINSRA